MWASRLHRQSFLFSPTTEVRADSSLHTTSASFPTGNPTSMAFLSESVSLVGFASPAFARVCPYQQAIRLFLIHVNCQFRAMYFSHLMAVFARLP